MNWSQKGQSREAETVTRRAPDPLYISSAAFSSIRRREAAAAKSESVLREAETLAADGFAAAVGRSTVLPPVEHEFWSFQVSHVGWYVIFTWTSQLS